MHFCDTVLINVVFMLCCTHVHNGVHVYMTAHLYVMVHSCTTRIVACCLVVYAELYKQAESIEVIQTGL